MKFGDDQEVEDNIDKILVELITKGTSGLSSARVAFDTATSMAELRAENALMRT